MASKLSRREFLKVAGVVASSALLGACTPRTSTRDVVETEFAPVPTPTLPLPTPTEVPPTATSVVVVEPGGFEMVLVEVGSFEMGSASGRSA